MGKRVIKCGSVSVANPSALPRVEKTIVTDGVKVSELDEATALTGDTWLPVVQENKSKKAKLSQLEALLSQATGVEPWQSEKVYRAGSLVQVRESLWLSRRENQGSAPLSSRASLYDWAAVALKDPITVSIPDLFDDLTAANRYFRHISSSEMITLLLTADIADGNVIIDNSAVKKFVIDGKGFTMELGEKGGISASGSGVNVDIIDLHFRGAGATRAGTKWSNNSVAAFSLDGAAMTVWSITTEGVYYGAQAARATLRGFDSIFNRAGDAGAMAFNGGQIALTNCEANHSDDNNQNLGWGFVAEINGSIWLQDCKSTGNALGGLFANIGGRIKDERGIHTHNHLGGKINAGSQIELHGCDISLNVSTNIEILGGMLTAYSSSINNSAQGHGVFCSDGARVDLFNCVTNDNHLNGVCSQQLSIAKLNTSHTATGNTDGAYNLKEGVLSSDGALIVD